MPTQIPQGLKDRSSGNGKMTGNSARLTVNASESLMRSQFLSKLLDPRRDIDTECGYPKDITPVQYRYLYDREGIAQRVVSMFPTECWASDPMVRENEDSDPTEFEETWEKLQKKMNLWHFIARADEMSGIGAFGILLLGLNDGKPMFMPVDGISETGKKVGNPQHELLFCRVFDESLVEVAEFETDESNPRFGQPVSYSVTFADPRNEDTVGLTSPTGTQQTVHWTRCLHLADNRKSSEIFGVPRMRPVYNRLYDLRKLLGGSAEMFWKGAFPGFSFEVNPDLGDVELDGDALRTEFEAYSNGLQRYLALSGVTAKSLAPQVASPEAHVNTQIKAIAITMAIPWRIFVGSEQAQLASAQDKHTWNTRVSHRQHKYVGPLVIRPFIDRLIALGILPEVEEFVVEWEDLASPSDEDKAIVAAKVIEAVSKYVQAGVDTLIPPMEFFTIILGMHSEQAQSIIDAANEQADELELEEGELEQPVSGEPMSPPPEEEEEEEGGSIEIHIYESKEEAMKEAKEYGLSGVHAHPFKDGTPGWMPGKDMKEFEEWFTSKGRA